MPTLSSSFRDPAGSLVALENRVLRVVRPEAADGVLAFLSSSLHAELRHRGWLVATRIVGSPEVEALRGHAALKMTGLDLQDGWVFEHQRIPFPSFPHEWPPEMLHAAATLTLDLAETALPEGWILKDATPFNVLFHGNRPIFVDLLSFQHVDPGETLWRPYAQFVRTFVLPLLVHRYFGISPREVFLVDREGLEPQAVYPLCTWTQRIRPPFMGLVTLPKLLSARRPDYSRASDKPLRDRDPERTRFVLGGIFRYLRRVLRAVEPRMESRSAWTDYAGPSVHPARYHEFKRKHVARVLAERQPAAVLDVGCNTGELSLAAARAGARVVAIDSDSAVVGRAWRRAAAEQLNLLPLVVDIAAPTPGLGWRNRESASFLERSTGRFDLVLMLGLVHHLLVTRRIPLREIVALAAELTTELALIEYVPPDDPWFRELLRGRDHLHQNLDFAGFEAECRTRFEVLETQAVPETGRVLLLLRKRMA